MRKLHNKVLILCLVTLLIDNRVMSNRNDKTSQCVIKNLHYKNEYLIATNYSDKYIDDGKFVYQNRKKAVIDKLPSYDFLKDSQVVWTFVPSSNQTFFIKSSMNRNQYLCATDTFVDRLKHRRKVNLNNLDRKNQYESLKCQWKVTITNGNHLIKNHFYKEPMYAANMFYSSGRPLKRNLFTWKNKNANSDQFYWGVYCQN